MNESEIREAFAFCKLGKKPCVLSLDGSSDVFYVVLRVTGNMTTISTLITHGAPDKVYSIYRPFETITRHTQIKTIANRASGFVQTEWDDFIPASAATLLRAEMSKKRFYE